MQTPRGAVLLEAMISVGVAGTFMAALVGLVLASNSAVDRADEVERALWSMNEGLQAAQTIAFNDLALTNSGSLTLGSSGWTLGTGGPQTLSDGMRRTVRVQTVNRDSSCNVVTSGGTADVDSKYIESEVTWTDAGGRNHIVSERTLRTRWDDPQGPCFVANQAGQVEFTITTADFYGGKQLREVYMTNTGGADVTIDRVIFTWNYPTTMDQIFIDSSKVWSIGGPGSPGRPVNSGEEIDIENFTIVPGFTAELNKGQFSGAMGGATVTMSVIFADGSVYTSPAFTPL